MSPENGPYKGKGDTVYATRPEKGSTESEKDWPDHTDPEWLKYQYHVLGKTQKEMGEVVGKHRTTIRYQMKKYDITTRDRSEASVVGYGTPGKLRDEGWLREQYVEKEVSPAEIAEKVDVSPRTVYNALEREGVEIRDRSEANELRAKRIHSDRKYSNPEWLKHQYLTLGKSSYQIARENDWGVETVRKALERHGIPLRSRTSATLIRYKTEKCPTGDSDRDLVSPDGIDASWRDLKDRNVGCYIQYRDPKWLREQVESGLSYREIAAACDVDCTYTTIKEWIGRFGIERD